MTQRRIGELAPFIALSAGTLAFGAVYRWAYWPMLFVAAIGVAAGAGARLPGALRGLAPVAWLMAFCVAGILIQLAPLPQPLLRSISPATDSFLREFDFGYAVASPGGSSPWHPLSISPGSTAVGLVFVVVLFAVVLHFAATLSERGAARMCLRLTVLGLALAVIGIVQYSFHTARPYGFWRTVAGTDPFGPFVNRDNYAGWMLMALGAGIGYVSFLLKSAPAGQNHRTLMSIESSERHGKLAVALLALAIMLLALLLTVSRASLGAFALTAALFGVAGLSRSSMSRGRKAAWLAGSIGATAVLTTWAGVDRLVHKFSSASWNGLGHRTGVWRDTLDIVHDFPAFGTGFNTFGVATLVYNSVTAVVNRHFVQAHNDLLQLAAEGGVLLTVPALLLMAAFAFAVYTRFARERSAPSRMLRVGAMFGLVAIAMQDMMHFSLLIPANALFAAVLAGIALRHVAEPRIEESR